MSFDLKIENSDLKLQNGKIFIVEGTEKLIQDILKICLTEIGSNPLQPGYGSYISRSTIGNGLETSITVQIAQTHLNNALENLKLLQDLQSRSFQQVAPQELIAAILNVSVQQNKILPTLFDVQIDVASKALTRVQTNFNINFL